MLCGICQTWCPYLACHPTCLCANMHNSHMHFFLLGKWEQMYLVRQPAIAHPTVFVLPSIYNGRAHAMGKYKASSLAKNISEMCSQFWLLRTCTFVHA